MLALAVPALFCAVAATTYAAPAATTAPASTAISPREVDPAVAAFLEPIEAANDDDGLRQKMKERHNTAVRLLQVHIDRYRNGVADASAVFESAREVAQCKMALARNAAERETVARQVVETTRAVESRVERQWKAGLGIEVNVLRARLARETAEIELLKLQQSSSATGPATTPPPPPTTQPRSQ